MIELKNVHVGYGHKTVLKNMDVVFNKGEITCIIGPNGSGKSTLLKTILNVLPPACGHVLLDHEKIGSMKSCEIAKKMAYLSQGRSVPEMTVEQLVLHGRFPYLSYPRKYRKQDMEIAVQAMQQMGIADMADRKLAELSGGMRQSAYIAMALAQSTEYILLDEPNTYLDIANQLQLMKILKKLASEGKGIILVLHDLTLAMEYADRIVLLHEGEIQIADTPEEVVKSQYIERIFGVHLNQIQEYYYYQSLV